ncbi:class I SAM-dependent methyltransferase [Candidatus Methanomassiliicoccus intestinalis]|jgi:methionine biosynthesis protein metW|uniref:Methyltransferase n=2 Tax=Candidatus Methanomassiliicoccus intestinalis TaxID=1406512 RepID=A0A8J8TEQ9_9ARCH|nr:MAG: methyltransferase [Candidatus Methanomassiliicoccus intestinalis]
MNQKEYWDKSTCKTFTAMLHLDELSLYLKNDDSILDVGCGYGRTLYELYSNGYKNLKGVDFSSKMIEKGKQLYPFLDLTVKRDKTLEFDDCSYDAVILSAVLTCIADDNEQKYLLDDIFRILKPDGIIYVTDFLINCDRRNLIRYDLYASKYSKYGVFETPDGAVLRHHDIVWIKELLSSFKMLTLKNVVYDTMNGHTSNAFYFIGKK